MDEKAALAEIREREARISTDREFIDTTQQALAEARCPFTVGQSVARENRSEWTVASIGYRDWGTGFTLTAFKTKKDGTPYKYASNVWFVENVRVLHDENPTERLHEVTRLMCEDNNLELHALSAWPGAVKGFLYSDLNEQAAMLHEGDFTAFTAGVGLADEHNLQALRDFLSAVFDGHLSNVLIKGQ